MSRPLITVLTVVFSVLLVISSTSQENRLVKREELGVGRTGVPLCDLFSATLDELQAGFAIGSFSCVDLVSVFPIRIPVNGRRTLRESQKSTQF